MLLLFDRLFFLFLLPLKVILRELTLLLCFFANEQTLFAITLDSCLILGDFHGLVNIELKDLH